MWLERKKLYKAIVSNDYVAAKELINAGADVNKRVKYGFTPIFRSNNPETTKLLIEKGAKVNISGGKSITLRLS